jgi:hypothetical protein
MKKVNSPIVKENSPTQRFIASKLEMFSGTTSKIIDKGLRLKKMFKTKVICFYQSMLLKEKQIVENYMKNT